MLTGTPLENSPEDLWSIFDFLQPGMLGNLTAFRRYYADIRNDSALQHDLAARIAPFVKRRTKAMVTPDLPPKHERTIYCEMEPEQRRLYDAVLEEGRRALRSFRQDDARSNAAIFTTLLRLRQICCHPRLLKVDMPGFSTGSLPSGKFEAFKDMIFDVVEGGHKVLVFSQFVQMLQIIRGWLQLTDIPFCYLDGTSKDRLDQVDRFNSSPDIPIFLISLKAGGTGINLTSADYVIHYDPWWNPAVESQATDRTHRIGQTRQVFSYKLICQNTVEEKILKLQEMKRGVAEAVIPGQDTWKSLTKEDLEMLFEV